MLLLLAGGVWLAGCSSAPEPFEYHSDREIPEGPGVFSKESGEFTLYDSDAKKKEGAEGGQKAEQSSGAEAAAGTAGAATGGLAADSAEYEAFQQWKKEQMAFEEFQKWKNSPQGAKEYEEFKEWQRWKAYKEWQEANPQHK